MKSTSLFIRIIFFTVIMTATQCRTKLYKTYTSDFYAVNDTLPSDRKIDAFILPFKQALDSTMNIVIGESLQELNKIGKGETSLGNFVADMQIEYAEETFGYPIDISVMNNGGLRNNLPEGEITVRHIFELSPFDNYLYVLSLKGEDVKKLAEYAVRQKNLGIHGMYLESKDNLLATFTIQGKPIETGKIYLLAINDYLADGGDQMDFLIDLPRIEKSNILIREFLIERIKKKTAQGIKLDARIEGRQKLD